MPLKRNSCVYILILLSVFLGHVQTNNANEVSASRTALQLTIDALHRLLQFFEKEYKIVNLDGIIGTRIVDDQLRVLLRHIEYDEDAWPVESETIDQLKALQELAGDVSDKAIPYIKETDPEYYKRIGMLVQPRFWELDFASRDFSQEDMYHAWRPRPGEAMREQESDNCLTELFGTGPYTNVKCHISAACWELLTEPGYSGYSLTHQVFYLQIAYQMGCFEQMDHQRLLHGQPPPSDLVETFCAAIFVEAKNIAEHGYPETKQDLFMEQAALCGLMGFRFFFDNKWLDKMLEWQDIQTGCYKGSTMLESEVLFRNTAGAEGSRVKREERLLDDGCLAHKTTVAAGALVCYIRYIIEYQRMVFQSSQIVTNQRV